MVMTQRGIYHNLDKSKYAISNGEIAFFFSSRFYMGKFLEEHKEYREIFIKRLSRSIILEEMYPNTLADIHFYKLIEKRGFKAFLFHRMAKNVVENEEYFMIGDKKVNERSEVDWHELHQFALAKMTEKNTGVWSEMHVQR